MRDALKSLYDNLVQPAILNARADLVRRLARLVAPDPTTESDHRSVAYTQKPWVVERSVLGELEPFTNDGVHLLSSEGEHPLPLEEREANGRLIKAAPRHDARLRATTAFLRRLVSAHPEEIANYLALGAEHFEENIVALEAVEADAEVIPPELERDLQILEDYWTALDAVPTDAIDPVLTGLAQKLGMDAESLRIAYHYRKNMGAAGIAPTQLSLLAQEDAALDRSLVDEPAAKSRSGSLVGGIGADPRPSDLDIDAAASLIVRRVLEVRNILREQGWDGAPLGEMRKDVGDTTLGFDHKVEVVGCQPVTAIYFAWHASETEHDKEVAPLVQFPDPWTLPAAELVSRFQAQLSTALRARGIDIDLQPGGMPDEPDPS
jgi:hypothetical protein